MDKLFIAIDGNSLMHRAFHAMAELTDAQGNPTGAVYGFMMMLLNLMEKKKPSYLAVAFDPHGPTFRHQVYADYKGTRPPMDERLRPQFPMVKGLLEEMGIRMIEVPGFEADDVLGTLAARCDEKKIPALLVTGDRDSMQLVTESVHVLFTRKGISDTKEYTPDAVREDFGVRPDQIPDLKGLMGDSSDNIPGVRGVGEKTAVRLLQEYETVEGTYENLNEQKGALRTKLEAGREDAKSSKWLATITREVPIQYKIEECVPSNLRGGIRLFKELGFRTLLPRLTGLCAAEPEQPAPKTITRDVEWGDALILDSAEKVDAWAKNTSCTALFWGEQLTAAWQDGWAVIPIRQDLLSCGLGPEEAFSALMPLFDKEHSLCLFGAKAFLHELEGMNIVVSPEAIEDDVQLAAWILNPLNVPKTLAEAETDPADARGIWTLRKEQKEKLSDCEMTQLYREIELPLMRVLISMERTGVRTSREELARQGSLLLSQQEELKKEIFSQTGGEFNLNSPKQLGEVLFERLKLPAGKKTSRGWSTDAETLENLTAVCPVVGKILEYRKVAKLYGTYIEGLVPCILQDGRVHTCFDQTATVTGRLASNEPNLQNIPVRTELGREIRKAFCAQDGWTLVDADYSQIELRLLAHLSGDAGMISAFREGRDIHTATAAEVYGVPLQEVTPQMRSAAKAVNFGIVYGISDFGLARNIGVTRKEAASFIERYFERYPGVRRYMDETVASGKHEGYAKTMFGRRRPLPELNSSNFNVRSFGERAAMNTPVQGSAADLIKIAMIRVSNELKKQGLSGKLIMQIHDELIVEAPKEEAEQTAILLKNCMEEAAELQVPLIAEVQCGFTWFDAK